MIQFRSTHVNLLSYENNLQLFYKNLLKLAPVIAILCPYLNLPRGFYIRKRNIGLIIAVVFILHNVAPLFAMCVENPACFENVSKSVGASILVSACMADLSQTVMKYVAENSGLADTFDKAYDIKQQHENKTPAEKKQKPAPGPVLLPACSCFVKTVDDFSSVFTGLFAAGISCVSVVVNHPPGEYGCYCLAVFILFVIRFYLLPRARGAIDNILFLSQFGRMSPS